MVKHKIELSPCKENIKSKLLKMTYDVFLVVLILIISIAYTHIHAQNVLIEELNDLKIGQSIDYMETHLGIPIFEYYHSHENITEQVYNNKYSVVRAYFDNEKLVGFFVTAKEKGRKISMPEQFEIFCNGNTLGKFTFKEIHNKPQSLVSYITNGTGHVYYCEDYYFASRGNYYQFYFGYVDYGFYDMESSMTEFEQDEEIVDILPEKTGGMILIDRSESYPNTYGIVEAQYNTVIELFSNYNTFNLQALRK